MTEEPRSLTLQRRSVPRHVEAAVHRALSKLPADRFASAAQFAEALLNPGAMTRSEPLPGTAGMRVRSRWALPAAGGLALLAAGGAFLAGRVSAPSPASPVVRFTMELPDSVQGIGRCCGTGLALSPDGSTLVFVGNKGGAGVGGPFYRRSLGRLDAEPIPGTDGGSVPFISPDGRWLGFFLDGRLRKVALAGGPPIPIAVATSVAEASWGAGNRIVFSDRGQLWTVAASGGVPRPLTKSDSTASHYAPSLLPDGKAVLLTIRPRGAGASEARIGVADLESGRVDTIGLGTRATYANGYLVFAAVYFVFALAPSQGALWAAMACYGLFYALTNPVLRALVAQSTGNETRGRAFGIFFFVSSVAVLLSSIITGELWKHYGPRLPFYLSAGLAATAAGMLLAGVFSNRAVRAS